MKVYVVRSYNCDAGFPTDIRGIFTSRSFINNFELELNDRVDEIELDRLYDRDEPF